MNDSFIRIMNLQSRLRLLKDDELTELQELLIKNACTCETSADCKGICAVERRVTIEKKRRTITSER
jgi:hypothetical protein